MAQELEERKMVFHHFYHPDLHIYINIWRFCTEKVEAELSKQKKKCSAIAMSMTLTSPI